MTPFKATGIHTGEDYTVLDVHVFDDRDGEPWGVAVVVMEDGSLDVEYLNLLRYGEARKLKQAVLSS